ncbi:MAG: sensor histidine kinase [Flavobacteriales bacterium]|nr:sensor histidine kinase [Flavobacteriales bacterium]
MSEINDSLYKNSEYALAKLDSILAVENSDTVLYRTFELKGLALHGRTKYGEAVLSFQKMLELAIEMNDTFRIYNARNRLSGPHFYLGNYKECFELYHQNYTMVENMKECQMQPTAILNLANMYYYLSKKDKALRMQHKANQVAVACKDKRVTELSARNIAAIYTEKKMRDSAIIWMKYGIGLIEEGNLVGLSNATSILGGVYNYPEEKDSMYYYFNRARHLAEKAGDSATMAFVYLKLCSYYIQENILDSAAYFAKVPLRIYRRLELVDGIQHALGYLVDVYQKEENKEKALTNLWELFRVRDTILDEITAIKTAELETMYETEKKERENLELKAENDKKEITIAQEKTEKSLLLFGAILFALLLSSGAFIWFLRVRLKQKEKLAQLEKEKTGAIIAAEEKERTRIARELHDGVGQMLSGLKLNFEHLANKTIDRLPEEREAFASLLAVVDEACKDVRTISHQMMPRALQEQGLVLAIEEMLAQSLNHSPIKYQFEHFQIDSRFDNKVELSLYRICQELVNNIIKHSSATELNVQLYKAKNQLIMIVEDNGKGFQTGDKKDGIGLLNMNSRIDTVKGIINFDSSPNSGTTATVRVPLG